MSRERSRVGFDGNDKDNKNKKEMKKIMRVGWLCGGLAMLLGDWLAMWLPC